MESRIATVERHSKETQIKIKINLDEPGYDIDTQIPFFDHMLEQLSQHSKIGIKLHARGDLDVDFHHTVEDVGIVLGQALRQALGDKKGIERFAHAYVPLDESLSRSVLDLSGRPGFFYSASMPRAWIGQFDVDLIPEFFAAFCNHAQCTLHLENLCGKNAHHIAESLFKSMARALKGAIARTLSEQIPSTKGSL